MRIKSLGTMWSLARCLCYILASYLSQSILTEAESGPKKQVRDRRRTERKPRRKEQGWVSRYGETCRRVVLAPSHLPILTIVSDRSSVRTRTSWVLRRAGCLDLAYPTPLTFHTEQSLRTPTATSTLQECPRLKPARQCFDV